MSTLKRIIFLLMPILVFSCQTRLEKQGWQRIAIVSRSGASTINKKDKELIIVKIKFSDKDSSGKFLSNPFLVQDKNLYSYWLSVFKKDSTGKIINGNCGFGSLFNSDIAYYKWESDSVCLVKLLNQGDVQTSGKLLFNNYLSGFGFLDEPKK